MSSGGQWKIISAKATRNGTSYAWDSGKNMMVPWSLNANNGGYTDRSILSSPYDSSPTAGFGGSGAVVQGAAKNGYTAKASQDFDVTVKIQWVPGYGKTLQTDPAPDKASLLVTSRVGVQSQSAAAPDFKLSNGLDSPTKDRQPSFTGDGVPRLFESKGTVLVPVSVSGGQGEVTLKLHGNGTATASSASGGTDAVIYLDADFRALPDKRQVWLSRPGSVGEKRSVGSGSQWVTEGDSVYAQSLSS